MLPDAPSESKALRRTVGGDVEGKAALICDGCAVAVKSGGAQFEAFARGQFPGANTGGFSGTPRVTSRGNAALRITIGPHPECGRGGLLGRTASGQCNEQPVTEQDESHPDALAHARPI